MCTEFIAQELRDDELSWSLWQRGPCVTCVQLGWFLLLIKANNTMWLKQSRSLIRSHNWKTQPWGMDWSALQIQFFSVFFLICLFYLSSSHFLHRMVAHSNWRHMFPQLHTSGTKGHFFNTIKQSSKHYDDGSVNMCSGEYHEID